MSRLAIVGMGKMGKAVAELAPSRGWEITARLGRSAMEIGVTRELLAGADVAIEFTTPDTAAANALAIVAAGCPVVVGTTGWYDDRPRVVASVTSQGGAMITASNFSIGANVFDQIVETAAKLLGGVPGFEAHLTETHHSAKKDAPSGTALMLHSTASAAFGRDIPITSVRVGSVPGTHEFTFDAPFEQIHLAHIARDRRVFAEGALVAAAWLIGKRGAFTMRDVLSTPSHPRT